MTDEEGAVQELAEVVGALAQQYGGGVRRQVGELGQVGVGDVHVVDEVLDRQADRDLVLAEDHDRVLAVRGEGGAVGVEEVQQRGEDGVQETGEPFLAVCGSSGR